MKLKQTRWINASPQYRCSGPGFVSECRRQAKPELLTALRWTLEGLTSDSLVELVTTAESHLAHMLPHLAVYMHVTKHR
jgi:hypothetical protein